MKTRDGFSTSLLCLILLALVTACNTPAVPAVESVVPNPSFEQGEASAVRGWEGMHGDVTFTWSEGSARTGQHSICISDLPAQRSADWTTTESILITEGTTYTLSAYVKGDFDREVYIMVFPVDNAGNQMDGIATDVTFTDTDWTYAEVAFEAPSGAVAVVLDFGVNNSSDTATTGMICFDDVSLE